MKQKDPPIVIKNKIVPLCSREKCPECWEPIELNDDTDYNCRGFLAPCNTCNKQIRKD